MISLLRTPLQRWYANWVTRRHPPSSGQVELRANRLYILPSGRGVGFAVSVLLLLLASMNYNNNLAYFMTFWLGSLFISAMLFTYRNLRGLQIRLQTIEDVFAGEPQTCVLRLENPTPLPRVQVRAQLAGHAAHSGSVAAHHYTLLALRLPTPRRGRFLMERLRIDTDYPLGLFRCWTYVHLRGERWVYPAPLAQPLLMQGSDDPDTHRALQQDDGDSFEELRQHRPGEPLSRISWKQFARTGELMTKHFPRTSGAGAYFIWDELPGDTEQRLSILSYLIHTCHQQQRPFGLSMPGTQTDIACSDTHVKQCLRRLAEFGT